MREDQRDKPRHTTTITAALHRYDCKSAESPVGKFFHTMRSYLLTGWFLSEDRLDFEDAI